MFSYYLYFVLVLLGLFFIFISKDLLLAWKSNSWIATEGKIIESKLLSHGRSMMIGYNYERYSALIKYEYKAEDQKYESNKVRFFPMGTSVSKNAVEKLLAEYPSNSAIEVYYDPEHPNQALLQKGLNFKAFFTLIAISFFITFLLLMLQNDG